MFYRRFGITRGRLRALHVIESYKPIVRLSIGACLSKTTIRYAETSGNIYLVRIIISTEPH